jgi:transposase
LLLPKRWVVERTFAWLGRYRIHSRDYERLTKSKRAPGRSHVGEDAKDEAPAVVVQ